LRIDPETGAVMVRLGGQPSDAFLAKTGAHRGRVRWERASAVQPAVRYGAGAAITSDNTPACTGGFAMKSVSGFPYVVTAGHCVSSGVQFWYSGGNLIGPTAYLSFPGNDYAVILMAYNSPFEPSPTAVHYLTGPNVVFDTNEPFVGQPVCKSGAVTGVTCGTVLALDVTVTYHGGHVVDGLIETDVCALKGDSGSPLFRPRGGRLYGVGILSGANLAPCGDPSTRSYSNPLTEVMTAYGLSLYTR
jgi:hypothetical protein